jgi:hypothetical protein
VNPFADGLKGVPHLVNVLAATTTLYCYGASFDNALQSSGVVMPAAHFIRIHKELPYGQRSWAADDI